MKNKEELINKIIKVLDDEKIDDSDKRKIFSAAYRKIYKKQKTEGKKEK